MLTKKQKEDVAIFRYGVISDFGYWALTPLNILSRFLNPLFRLPDNDQFCIISMFSSSNGAYNTPMATAGTSPVVQCFRTKLWITQYASSVR